MELQARFVSESIALEMVQKYHYSNTLPKLNKAFVGFYMWGEIVGLITLGWGTRPLQTIQSIFPTLITKDYLEIGRMVMTEEMPRNSESQMIHCLVKFIHLKMPSIKILFTWADGMLGKCGYVYQASGFHYLGYSKTDIYLSNDGTKIHPRQTRELFKRDNNDTRISCRPSFQQMEAIGMKHYYGRQFKYFRYLCGRLEANRLSKNCLVDYKHLINPKEKDLKWEVCISRGKYQVCDMPPYKTDIRYDNYTKKINSGYIPLF